jgi:hypothetical protein
MNQEDFTDFFTKLLVETDKIEESPDLFSMHKSNPPDQPNDSPTSAPTSDQDQSPTSGSPSQDQAEPPFEEAVPLEDELANLLDDID